MTIAQPAMWMVLEPIGISISWSGQTWSRASIKNIQIILYSKRSLALVSRRLVLVRTIRFRILYSTRFVCRFSSAYSYGAHKFE